MRLSAVPLRRTLACLAVAGALMLGACGGDKDGVARRADGSAMDPLPTPEGARGSITGMPDKPGPGQPGDNASVSGDEALAIDDIALDGDALDENGDAVPEADANEGNAEAEPTSEDAANLIQGYYDAIQSQEYADAYRLWSDGGRASGQTPQQFAAGFADTASVIVTVDVPVPMDAAMGSRFVEVPVAVESTARDGRVRRFVGAYTMRRSVVSSRPADQ